MTVEIHATLIALLANIDELRSKEAASNLRSSAIWSKSRSLRAKFAAAMMNSAPFVKTNLG